MNISAISSVAQTAQAGGKDAVGGFSDMLSNAIKQADELNQTAQTDTTALLSGQESDIAQMMINGTKAQIALETVVAVRNKVLDAYNEVMRMQL